MKSIQETMDWLLTHHAGTAPIKPNVPLYLGNLQRLLNTEQGYIEGYWLQRMFLAAVNALIGHDLIINCSREPQLHRFVAADLADLQHVLEAIAAEVMFLNGQTADPTPGYHADLLHMHIQMAKALVDWEHNEWEAHTVNSVIRIAALLVRRSQAWMNYGTR